MRSDWLWVDDCGEDEGSVRVINGLGLMTSACQTDLGAQSEGIYSVLLSSDHPSAPHARPLFGC